MKSKSNTTPAKVKESRARTSGTNRERMEPSGTTSPTLPSSHPIQPQDIRRWRPRGWMGTTSPNSHPAAGVEQDLPEDIQPPDVNDELAPKMTLSVNDSKLRGYSMLYHMQDMEVRLRRQVVEPRVFNIPHIQDGLQRIWCLAGACARRSHDGCMRWVTASSISR